MMGDDGIFVEAGNILRKILRLNEDMTWPMRGANKGKIDKNLMRIDGSAKGPGFFGPQPMTGNAEGNYATEISIGSAPNSLQEQMAKDKEGFFPLISESQDPTTMSYILSGRRPTQYMIDTARKDAERRKAKGQNPFAEGVALPGKIEGDGRFKPYKAPKPLKRVNEAQMMEATRRLQNKAAYDAMSKPGAMVLDSPAMPYLNEQQRKDFHARHGVLYRQGGPATSDQLPKDTIIVHPPKEWK